MNPDTRLTYVHKDGLIMRHDKDAFAKEAIESAFVGKIIGDYIRILYFSAYAEMLTDDLGKIKEIMDPFTGCFISSIPMTIVYLRFVFMAVAFFSDGKDDLALEFIKVGSDRLMKALALIKDKDFSLKQIYENEKKGWDIYYDTILAIEDGIKCEDFFSLELQKKAKKIIKACAISSIEK